MNSSLMLYIDSMGWTLIHTLWQGCLLWLLFRLTQFMLRAASPEQRHANALLWLVVLLSLPLLTFALHITRDAAAFAVVESSEAALNPVMGFAFAHALFDVAARFTVHNSVLPGFAIPALAILWLACVTGRCWRLHHDWLLLNRIASKHSHALSLSDFNWQPLLDVMNSPKTVQIRESFQAQVPMVVGWFKPVVLLPTSALLGLSPRELELIVAHELGHIRRHDHRINYLLVLAETVLFFHPAVFAITAVIRHERELCVDDLVIQTFKERLCYAHALSKLETLRGSDNPAGAWQIAATDGPLVKRITRLVEDPHGRRCSARAQLSTVAVWALGFAGLFWVHQHSALTESPVLASAETASTSDVVMESLPDSTTAQLRPISFASYTKGSLQILPTQSQLTNGIEESSDYPGKRQLWIERANGEDQLLANALHNKQVRDHVYALLTSNDSRPRWAKKNTASSDSREAAVLLARSTLHKAPALKPLAKVTSVQLEKSLRQQNKLFTAPATAFSQSPDTRKLQPPAILDSDHATTIVGHNTSVNPRVNSVQLEAAESVQAAAGERKSRISRSIAPVDIVPAAVSYQEARADLPVASNQQFEFTRATEILAEQDNEWGGEFLKGRQPKYPTRARGRGLTDKVTVALTISSDGQVTDVEVTSKNSRPMFRRAVVRAVSRWSYAPLIRNGQAVERRLEQSFDFRLDENTTARRGGKLKCRSDVCFATS